LSPSLSGMSDPATWRRLAAGTAAVFVATGAFLAGRVHAGDDPVLGHASSKSAQTRTTTQKQTQSQPSAQPQQQTDSNPPTTSAS